LNTRKAANEMLIQASHRLATVTKESKRGSKAYPIRSAQECAELALKAALKSLGIDYPKRHDVSRVLLEVKDRLPSWFAVDTIAEENIWLAERREPAMYGSETSDLGPDSLFSREDALTALRYLKHIFNQCKRLISPRSRKKRALQ
jgi:HEPN domain-containing protein